MNINIQIKRFLNIGIGTIFNIIIGLITTPIVTRLVDTADYGALSMFNTYAGMAVMILCLGLDQSLIRFYYDSDSTEYKRELITKTALVSIGMAIAISIILYCRGDNFFAEFDFKGTSIIALLVYICIQLSLRFALIILRVEYLTKQYALLNVANKAIYLISVVILMLFSENVDHLSLLILSTIISSSIPLLIALIYERKMWKPALDSFSKDPSLITIIKYGFPFILSMGITTVFEALDKLSINRFCDYTEVGIYSSAITIVNVFTIVQTTFNTVWSPMAIERYTKNSNDVSFFKTVNNLITVIMFAFGITLILFKDVFVLLLGEKYRNASLMVPFLIFHPIMYTISETTSMGIDFAKKSYLHIIVATCACISNAIGNTLLVPIMGGKGAAISTGLAYIVFFAVRTFFGLSNFNYNPCLSRLVILTVLTILYAGYSSFYAFNLMTIIIYVIIIGVLVVVYSDTFKNIFDFAYNFIKKKEL